MEIRPIRTEEDHKATLKEISALWNAPEGTPEGDRLDVLLTLCHAWEEEHFRLREETDPVAMVKFVMEQRDLTRADLAKLLGGESRASEFLNGRRALSINQIRRLRDEWRIPADLLIPPAKAPAAA